MAEIAKLAPDQDADFCLTLDFPPLTRDPSRILKSGADAIIALQKLDSTLVKTVDPQIQTIFILQDATQGSIKLWLKMALEAIDDEALKKLDWRSAVGRYIVQAKYFILKHLNDNNGLGTTQQLDSLKSNLFELAERTDARRFPGYRSLPAGELAQSMKMITDSAAELVGPEKIIYTCNAGEAVISPTINITHEAILDALADRRISNTLEKILLVRRPDFLGDAMWEFKYDKRAFTAKMKDERWLASFRAGQEDIRPGDALHVMVEEATTYDRNGAVLSESQNIIQVIGVKKQTQLSLPRS